MYSGGIEACPSETIACVASWRAVVDNCDAVDKRRYCLNLLPASAAVGLTPPHDLRRLFHLAPEIKFNCCNQFCGARTQTTSDD